MTKIKRSEILTYLDVTPDTEDYELVGDGVVEGTIQYNPQTSEETYINEDNATITVERYAPTVPVTAIAKNGDAVFEFVDALRIARAILDDAETTVVNVWNYETGGPTAAPAEQQVVSISIVSFGGPGGESAKIEYGINFIGDPVPGTFNITTEAFTAT